MEEQEVLRVFNSFSAIVSEQQQKIDALGEADTFGEFATNEELFRYWLTCAFLSSGHRRIEHQKKYPSSFGRGSRKADIVVDDALWVELKCFCVNRYWSNEYSPEEILSDVERLQKEVKNERTNCMFCIFFLSDASAVPIKLQQMASDVTRQLNKEPIVVPQEYVEGKTSVTTFVWFW